MNNNKFAKHSFQVCLIVLLSLNICNTGRVNSTNNIFNSSTIEDFTVPLSGIVAWWPFEGNGDDIINNIDATTFGGTSYEMGKVGLGLHLNGSNSNAIFPASCAMDIGQSSGFTIETWIKPDDLSFAQPILEFHNGHLLGGVQI